MNRVAIYDTTLRDGSQGEGVSFTVRDKLAVTAKLDELARTGADVLVTANPGCLIQWRRGVAERGMPVRVEHLATWLAARIAR